MRGFLTNLKRKHKNLIDWFARLDNKENSTWNSSTPLWCGSYRGWHSNMENVYFGSNKGAQGYKFICSANKADGTEVTESLYQVLYLDNVLTVSPCCLLVLQAWRIEYVAETVENHFWSIYAANLSLVEKSHSLAAAHLIEIWRGCHDGDVTLL